MAWDLDSITSDTPGAALSDKLKTLVGSTDNWSFVENVPAGTGTGESGSTGYSVDVFKCAGGAGGNSAGIDFYVGVWRNSSGNYLYVATFERYSPIASASNKGMCARPIGAYKNPAVVPDATDYTYDSADGTPNWRTFDARYSTYGTYWGPTLATTGFSYALKLTKDVLIIALQVGATIYSAYFGLFDSLLASDPMPLCCVALSGGNATGNMIGTTGSTRITYGGFSRLPGVTSSLMSGSGIASSASNAIWNAVTRPWLDPDLIAGGNGSGANDFWLGGVNLASRIAILQRSAPGTNTWPSSIGCIRGLLKADVLALYLPNPNVWDTTTVGAQDDWTVICGGTGYYELGAGLNNYSTITRAA